jgi:hypothetical protein
MQLLAGQYMRKGVIQTKKASSSEAPTRSPASALAFCQMGQDAMTTCRATNNTDLDSESKHG